MVALRRSVFSVLVVISPLIASAALVEFRVLVDADNSTATGCTVSGMQGVDHLLVTRVDVTETGASVDSSYRMECPAGVFGAQLDATTAGWDADLQMPLRRLWFETRMPYSAFGGELPVGMRFGFEAKLLGSSHTILTKPNSTSILFPPMAVPRRRSTGDARAIVMDESSEDWGEIAATMDGNARSGNEAVRILKVFLFGNGNDDQLYFGFETFVESDFPFAQDDNYSRQQGEGATIAAPGVLTNDGDPDGLPLTALPVSQAKHGDVVLNPDGSFTYSPDNPNNPRTDSFEYKANNGTKDSNVAKVKIKVSFGNDGPAGVDDHYTANEDEQLSVPAPGVLTNDTDPDGDTLTATLLAAPAHGTVALNANGGFTYTPQADFFGSDSFTYSLSDGEETDTAEVTITVESANDDPVALDVNVTTNEEQSVATTLSASDPEGDPLTYNVVNPANGSLSGTAPNLTYTPNLNFFGTDTFAYTATDGSDTSNVATVTITVNPVNDPPFFTSGGNVTSAEDVAYSAAWATGISHGAPNENTQTLTYNITNNTNPALFASGPTIAANGTLSFTPALNANGSADITVTLSDNGGGANTSAPATFTITITPVNDPPAFTSGGNVTVLEDSGAYSNAWATAVSAGPADESGQTLTFNITNNTNTGLFQSGPAIAANGTLSFTPALNMFGSADITVTLSDNGGGTNTSAPVTFTITVTGVNDEPSFTAGPDVTVDEDSGAYSAAWATAISAGPNEGTQTLTFSVTNNTNAGLFASGPAIDASGTLTFTLNANLNGSADITVELKDNGGILNGGDDTSAPATFTINVNAVNDAPGFTSGGNVTVNEDGPAYNAAWATAISKGPADENTQTLTFNITGNTNAGLFATGPAIDAAGNLSFTLNGDLNGSSDITVTLSDNGGGATDRSTPVTFTINVTPVNDEPVFTSGGNVASNEDTPYSAAWATGISAGPLDESAQTLTFNVTNNTNAGLFQTGPAIDASGNLSYTPALNASGSADITVNLTDSGSNVAPNDNTSASVTFTITINPLNDAPVITAGGTRNYNEADPPVTLEPLLTITDADSADVTCVASNDCYVIISGNPDTANDVLACPGCAAQGIAASWSGAPGMMLTLTGAVPMANYQAAMRTVTFANNSEGPGLAQRGIDWYIKDGAGAQNADTTLNDTLVNVAAVNDAPVNTVPGAQNTDEDFPLAFNGNVSIADVDALTNPVKVNLAATNGTLTLSGTTGLTFTTGTGTADTAMEFTGTIADINAALNGMTFTPTPDYNGAGSLSILTNDQGNTGGGGALSSNGGAPDVVTINIAAVNDAPAFVSGGDVTVNEDSSAYNAAWATSISKGPADENAQILTFNITGNTNAGLFATGPAIDPVTGNLSFTLNADLNGSSDITVTLSDDGSNVSPNDNVSDPVTFTITVDAVNDEPSFTTGGNVTSNEDEAYSAAWATGISKGPADENGQTLMFNVTNNTNAGLFLTGPAIDASGNLSYTPALNANGSADITVNLTDDGSNVSPSDNTSPSVTFTITVDPINDPPSFVSGGDVTVNEDSSAYNAAWATSLSKGPADENGQTLTAFNITGNTNAALFATGPSIDPVTGNLSFTLNANLNGSSDITVTLSDDGSNVSPNDNTSDPVTFTITVDPVNDEPAFTSGGNVTSNEDEAYNAAWATAISKGPADENSQVLTFNVTNNTNPSLFQTGPSIDASGNLTYTPAADANGSADITVNLTDDGSNVSPNDNTSASVTFTITVDPVNDEPSFTSGGNVTVNEDSSAYNALWATAISKGPADENGQVLTFNITGNTNAGLFATGPSIDPGTGNLSFTLNANVNGSSDITVNLTDDGSNVSPDDNTSASVTFTISVTAVNDEPAFTSGGNVTANEDVAYNAAWATGISKGPADENGQVLTFNVTNNTNPGLFQTGPSIDATTGNLSYTPASNANGSADITVNLTDDGSNVSPDDNTSASVTFTITVTAVNDAPGFLIAGDPPFILLGAGAQTVNTFATGIDDGDPELTQVLTFNLAQTGNTGTLAFDAAPAIDPSTGDLTYTPTAGTLGTVTFSVTLSDNGSGVAPDVNTSGAQSFTIAVEKAPEVTLTSPLDNATGVSTSTNITVTFDEQVSVTLVPASFKINCNAGPDLGFAYVGGTTDVTSVTIDPTATLPAGNCVVTVVANEIHDTDPYDPPDGLAVDYVFDFVTNTPPTATDDSATALGHITLTVADGAGVLSNDTDPDPGADLSVVGFGSPVPTTQGGTITFTEEGGYTYHSQAGDQNLTDTVNYTVTDQFGGTDVGTLSINLGARFIHVDDDHPTVTPDGRDFHPWKTMQQAQANSAANDTILVMSGTYTDHIVLQAGQSLIGQGIAANHVHTHNSVNFTVLNAGAAPSISRAAAGDTITLGTNNVIRGVSIGSTNGKGIAGTNFTSLTVNDNVTVSANGNSALHLDTGAVTTTFNSVSASSGGNSGLIFNALTGTMNINGGNISNTAGATLNLTGGSMAGTIAANFSTTGSSLINVASRTANALTLSGALSGSGTIAASANAAGTTLTFSGTQSLTTGGNVGVNLSANPGTISFTGGALAITTTNGNGFIASGATGNVNVTGANNTITTLTGIPLQMSGGVDIGASGVTFRSISANGAASGIVLADTGANAFTLAGTGTAGTGGTLQSIVGSAVSLTSTGSVNLNHLTINGAATGITGATFSTLTLRDLAVTAVSGLSLNTGTVNNAPASTAFTSLTTSGGTNGVAMTAVSGTFHVAAGTITGATGATFLVSGGNVGGTWSTNISQANNAFVMDINGTHSGSLTFAGTVSATNGLGLAFSNADGSYNFTGAATLSGGARITVAAGSGGTFTWDGDSSIGSSAGELVDIQSSAPTFTYSGTFIKTNSGRGIRALNNTGGSITFNGTGTKNINVNSGSSHAIDLDNNDGMTIAFSGNNLTLTTQTGDAFRAINGGTVTLTGTGNTITAVGGVGIRVSDTTIGAGGITLRSVSANGGSNGIFLSNTGVTGGFTITGDGTNNAVGGNASGGTIQNMTTGADATTNGIGIYMDNVSNVVLRRINVTGTHNNFGIRGFRVSNLTLENCTITGTHGTHPTVDNYGEGAVYFGDDASAATNGITGSASVKRNIISGGRARNFSLVNTTGTLNALVVRGNTFGHPQSFNDATDSFSIEARNAGTVLNVELDGSTADGVNTFSGSPGDQIETVGQTGTTMDVMIRNNTLSNNHPNNIVGGGGVTIATQGIMTFDFLNNTMTGADGSAITLQKASAGTSMIGTVSGNTIGTSGVLLSGSKTANGIFLSAAGAGTITLALTNNQIHGYKGNAGMYLDNTGGSYDLNVTITGNTTTTGSAGSTFAGLALAAGAPASADDIDICATITGNDFSNGDPANANDIILGVSGSLSSIRLPGYVPDGTPSVADIVTFIKNNNLNPATTAVTVYDDLSATAGSYSGGAACPAP